MTEKTLTRESQEVCLFFYYSVHMYTVESNWWSIIVLAMSYVQNENCTMFTMLFCSLDSADYSIIISMAYCV